MVLLFSLLLPSRTIPKKTVVVVNIHVEPISVATLSLSLSRLITCCSISRFIIVLSKIAPSRKKERRKKKKRKMSDLPKRLSLHVKREGESGKENKVVTALPVTASSSYTLFERIASTQVGEPPSEGSSTMYYRSRIPFNNDAQVSIDGRRQGEWCGD